MIINLPLLVKKVICCVFLSLIFAITPVSSQQIALLNKIITLANNRPTSYESTFVNANKWSNAFTATDSGINVKKKNNTFASWIRQSSNKFPTKTKNTLLIIGLIILVSAFGIWYWLKTLKTLVFIKTQQIKEIESRYRKLVENSYDPIFLQYEGKFLMVNNKFIELFEYSKEQLLEGTIDLRSITAPESIDYINDRLELLKKNIPSPIQYDMIGLSKTKRKINLTLSLSYIKYKDGYATQGIIHDITERIAKEKELRIAKERAEESELLKSSFLANMSHEIRTPMNGILGFSEMLKNENLETEERDQYISIIQESGNRMLNTINDIIDISKIHVGQVKLKYSEVNIIQEINQLIAFFKQDAKKNNLELELIQNCTSKVMITDETKFSSIISNLIKNAINYTNEGKIQVKCITENNQFCCWVKDTGIGISPDRQKSIFNYFYQVDGDNSRMVQGSGLGLSITKSYVEMLGGKISVISKPGEGSTFHFTIPLLGNFVCAQ